MTNTETVGVLHVCNNYLCSRFKFYFWKTFYAPVSSYKHYILLHSGCCFLTSENKPCSWHLCKYHYYTHLSQVSLKLDKLLLGFGEFFLCSVVAFFQLCAPVGQFKDTRSGRSQLWILFLHSFLQLDDPCDVWVGVYGAVRQALEQNSTLRFQSLHHFLLNPEQVSWHCLSAYFALNLSARKFSPEGRKWLSLGKSTELS